MNKLLNNRPRKIGRPARFLFIKTMKGRDFYLDKRFGRFLSVPAHGICTERSKCEGAVIAAGQARGPSYSLNALARAAHRLGFLTAKTYYAVA